MKRSVAFLLKFCKTKLSENRQIDDELPFIKEAQHLSPTCWVFGECFVFLLFLFALLFIISIKVHQLISNLDIILMKIFSF